MATTGWLEFIALAEYIESMEAGNIFPKRSRETAIRRDAQGRWFDGDVPIEHVRLARALDGWVDLAPDGRFCLRNRSNWAYVEIVGPPIFVTGLTVRDGGWLMQLSDGSQEPLRPEALRRGQDGVLYCDVREGRMVAGFAMAAMMAISEHIQETQSGFSLVLRGRSYEILLVADPLRSA